MSAAMSEQDIICERRGAAGCVLLNRPRALNALTHEMVEGLAAALEVWERDPAVERVVISGAGDRAFCAGGDVKEMRDKQGIFGGLSGQTQNRYRTGIQRIPLAFEKLEVPIIAAISGRRSRAVTSRNGISASSCSIRKPTPSP